MLEKENKKLKSDSSKYNYLITNSGFIKWVRLKDPIEELKWKDWIKNHPEAKEEFEKARIFVLAMPNISENFDVDVDAEAKKIMENALAYDTIRKERKKMRPSGKVLLIRITNRAASIIGFLVILSSLIYGLLTVYTSIFNERELITLISESKESKSILLSDKTLVQLNVKSKLTYPDEFQKSSDRLVELEGEAFFNVKSNAGQAFVVKTADLKVTVLGTKFNVTSYPDDADVEVSVLDGFVIVSGLDGETGEYKNFPLRPHEKLIYNKERENWILTEGFSESEIMWKEGILTFDNARFTQIIKDIERWYDVQIVLDPGINPKTFFTGKFNNNDLESIIDGICFTLDCSYKIDDKKVYINKK